MLSKEIENWSVETFLFQVERGKVVFDNIVQRSPSQWTAKRKSLFINTLLEQYPVPYFFASKTKDRTYDMLDGSQRAHAIMEFVANEYALSKNTPPTTLSSGEIYQLAKRKYSDLPIELQDRINSFMLNVYCFDQISESQVAELFFRINNGKPLSSIELTRVKSANLQQVHEAGKHELFQQLDSDEIKKYVNEDLIYKSWVVLHTDSPSFSNSNIMSIVEENVFTDDEILELCYIYDKMLEVYQYIKNNMQLEITTDKIMMKCNFISLVPIIKLSITNNIDVETLSKWVCSFLPNDIEGSISTEYNETTASRTTSREHVAKRHNTIMEHYRTYVASISSTDNASASA